MDKPLFSQEFLEDIFAIHGVNKEECEKLLEQYGEITITKEVVECRECKKPFMIFHGLPSNKDNQPCPYCGADYFIKIRDKD